MNSNLAEENYRLTANDSEPDLESLEWLVETQTSVIAKGRLITGHISALKG
jgi:hypothetical protein